MMKNACRIATLFLSIILMCGCADIPDMTVDQSEMVSQYAAALMLKYDSENHSRLVDVTPIVEEYNLKKQAFEEAANKYLEEQKKLEEAAQAEEEARREEAMNQNAAQNAYGSGNADRNDYTGGAIIIDETVSNMSIDEYVGLDNFSIEFSGYSEQKTLSSVSAFDISASKGKKFLVLSFNVSNNTQGAAVLDVLTKNVSFKVSVNGDKYYSVLISTIDNDLAQAYDSFNVGESKTFVLLSEIPDDLNVESVSMKIEMDDKNPIVKTLK